MERLSILGRDVLVEGSADRDLVLLVRLAARESGIWDALWAGLARRFRVAAIDLPQPSVEALENPPSAFRSYAALVHGVARELSPRPFHLVGWVGGTQIALQAMLTQPEALASAVLIAPFHTPEEPRQIALGLDILETLLRSSRRDLYVRHWFTAGLRVCPGTS